MKNFKLVKKTRFQIQKSIENKMCIAAKDWRGNRTQYNQTNVDFYKSILIDEFAFTLHDCDLLIIKSISKIN